MGAGVSCARCGGRGFSVPVFTLPRVEVLCAEVPLCTTCWGWGPPHSCPVKAVVAEVTLSTCSLGSGLAVGS